MMRAIVLPALLVVASPLPAADDRPRGEVAADRSLVYFIQPDGSRRYLFARQDWLGVADKDSYFFVQLDPGEHFVWADDARAYLTIYVAPGSTNYVRVDAKSMEVVDEQTGESLLSSIGGFSAPSQTDRKASSNKLKKYRKAYVRALRAGFFEPCRFAADKRAEYDRRVAAGDPQASHILGNLYWYGECVERDFAAAIDWYEDAARKGHLGAMVTLGNIYYRGTNVPEDPKQAAGWYLMAAERGDLFSQRRLAEMYREGHGVEANTEEAIKWYRRAADEGNDSWSLIQLETIDPETQEMKRREEEARARAEEEKQRKLEEQHQRIRARRIARIAGKYQQLALDVRPLERAVKLEPPRRKKPEEDGSNWDSNVAYALPPEIALGVVALSLVFNAVEKSLDSRLSGEEKEQIEKAAGVLAKTLSEEPVSRGLSQRIAAAGNLPDEDPLFIVDDAAASPPDTTDGSSAPGRQTETVLEIKATGLGLMLADKRYRQSHLVMANHVQLKRTTDGVVLKDRNLCYASKDTPNFSQWAADDGKLLKSAMADAYASTAETILLILNDEAYSTNTLNNELCEALLVTVEVQKAALAEPDR